MEETKVCKRCGRELPLSEFNKRKVAKDGYDCWCKECRKEYNKQYREEHKEEKAEYMKQYEQEHKEERTEYFRQYYSTPIGRASHLVSGYRQEDKKRNRGECTITPEWIADNIFTKPCHWCGETDWHKLGCDRIDNDKPHTPDNVNPCCEECNKKRGTKDYEEYLMYINY